MRFVFTVFVLIFMMTGCDDGTPTCEVGRPLSSTIIYRCSDGVSGRCRYLDGELKFAGCLLHAGTEENPDDVECVESCDVSR